MRSRMRYVLSVLATVTVLWNATAQPFDTTGCYLRQLQPVGLCQIESVGVDTSTDRIRITWRANHAEGVAGYCICSGSPCLPLDTLWSIQDTTYLCATHSTGVVHSYRIFAIDSCLHGGELTEAASNMVLQMSADSCSRAMQCSWNSATIDADEIQYVVWMQTEGGLLFDTVTASRAYQTMLPPATRHLQVRVSATGNGVTVWSNAVSAVFLSADSCGSTPDTSQHIIPKKLAKPFIPNCFTPMLSSNSCFAPCFPPESIPDEYHLRIYNRMGALVYQTRDVTACWNGTYEGSTLPHGTYVYTIHYRFADELLQESGTVMLLR